MYRLYPLFLFFIVPGPLLRAQTPDSLIAELKTIDRNTTNAPGPGRLLSNRALNIFLSNKIGSYLADNNDLTLYKNSVTADAATRTIAINHNLRQATGIDERVRSFMSIGAQAAVGNNSGIGNQFGFLLKKTWIATGHTNATPTQKKTMDALRTAILYTLITEIQKKTADLDKAITTLDSAAKTIAREQFNTHLREEYEYKYALLQSETLDETVSYTTIATHWTSIGLYVPLITETFSTAPSVLTPTTTRHAYPLQFDVTQTWFWESRPYGRIFLSFTGDAKWSNSRDGYALVLQPAQPGTKTFYTGDYSQFITPTVKGKLVYLPPTSHFGISFALEQNIGRYKALNGRLGFPIVLINKKAEPTATFEFQIRFFDMSDQIPSANGLPGHTSIGLTAGIPFSKIVY